MPEHKYPIEIAYSEEDGGYIANVPDLRYCSAFGETYEEALREVLGAMEVHLDTLRELDRPIPAPGSRRGVGVSALVLESGQTIELHEEAGGGFPGASWLSGGGEVDAASGPGGAVSGGAEGVIGAAEGAEEAIESIADSAGEAIRDIAESAAGAIEGIAAADTGDISEGTASGYGEDETGPQVGGRPGRGDARRPGRRSDG